MKYLLKIILPFSLLLASCTGKVEQKETTTAAATAAQGRIVFTAAQFRATGIVLGNAERRELSGEIKAAGKLDVPPQNMVTVSVPYGGIVRYTGLLQGMPVKTGQVLATLENPEYIQIQQDYAEAVHQLDYLKAEYQRQKELRNEEINAGKTYQKSQSDYEVMCVRAEALRQKLQLLGISPARAAAGQFTRSISLPSPIDGYVTKVLVNRGKFVQANDVLFELVDTRHTHCELSVFEKDIPRIHVNDKVVFRLANEDRDREAEVHLIGKEIRDDRTVQVHCHMKQEDPGLLPGTFITASILTGGQVTDALPEEAVVQSGVGALVYLLEQRKTGKDTVYEFRQVPVKTGLRGEGYIQVYLPAEVPTQAIFALKGAYALYSKANNTEEE